VTTQRIFQLIAPTSSELKLWMAAIRKSTDIDKENKTIEAAEAQISGIEKEFCDMYSEKDFDDEKIDDSEYVFVNIRRKRRNVVVESALNKSPS
jgi:hypothetical protein